MKKDMTKKPFFARLLEDQELDQVSGGADQTQKYPSDNDDHIASVKLPPDTTHKYPSDSDESEL
ncbi:microviridin/marinostatin family tricyclic proteinase inhibitor [Archangium lansingense]|uniref:Microviridin/marinostatin family tricyclic proteinase inhibitor n=1 Tax=Archangium lansingense TaxID=2995310 RepID=A0ABT4A302_9BACT|nr:microviridin/marinostatin family tricyclic proteinase inhibitor [Archangium lansinium]MCY1075354.1 microviridin/marinostatin family tricyclic proteinase inhibitor [Archangium lansinium]